MSKIVCPDCGSDNVMTERRPDGYHICRKCCFYWRNDEAPKPTLFECITASPEVLAEKLVYCVANSWGKLHWMSTVIGEKKFTSLNKAIAATVKKLKEIDNE